MLYYREIDNLDCTSIQQAVLKQCENTELPLFWNNVQQDCLDIIRDTFLPLGITAREYYIICTKPSDYGKGIHTDPCPESVRINVPVLNCEYSSTHYFKRNPGAESVLITGGDGERGGNLYRRFRQSDVQLVDQFRLIKPTLIRVHEPHAVAVLKGHAPRISITISFEEDLEPLLEHGLKPQP